MKTSNIIYFILFISAILLSPSCKKDEYRVGGDLHNPNINMTTYDYLKSNKYGLFDTLLLLVDKAGIKDKINQQGVTFFAPTDFAIKSYVELRTLALQKIDPFKKWTVDSIIKYELPRFADSLDIYFVKENLPNRALTAEGKIYKNLKNKEVVASYEETFDENLGYNKNSSVIPRVVYYTYLYQSLSPGFEVDNISYPVGIRTLVQTSNAQTNTGTLHVLSNSHTLFYFR
ncbi:fasciclin domain-containing protein [Sphingobacterium sp. xlx-130]|uniref:fasciclin domain-containing protein n=1 Tax=Sphingobacterium sp. xlx-130 TaxID=2654323 RepID=UPI0013DCA506|nr:fasciclin domain-containing protein [Sphingobacterium sp. xlx-130]